MSEETLEIAEFLADLRVALHRRRARAHRRGLLGLALLITGAVTSVAIAATYADWWSGGAAAVNPAVVGQQLAGASKVPAGVPRPILANARTVATTADAALVAAPTNAGGLCLIPSVTGQPDLHTYCEYDNGSGRLFLGVAGKTDANKTYWVAYGRITDAGATSIGLDGAGLRARVQLQRGGFFLFDVPQKAWATLGGTRNDLTVFTGSGEILHTGCVTWGTSPADTPDDLAQSTVYYDDSGCADEPAPPTVEFTPLRKPLTLPPIAGADVLTGKPVGGDLAGRAGFLVIWASYCRPCAKTLTNAQAFATAHPGVPVIGLETQDVPASAKTLLRQLDIDFPSVPVAGDILQQLGISGYPAVVAFDSSGNVVALAQGDVSPGTLATELALLG